MPQIDDTRIENISPLKPPAELLAEMEVRPQSEQFVYESRQAVESVLRGEDPRLLVVVGPCSIHEGESAREYARLLRQAADRHARELLVVMRVYFEKPRTTVGWKGFINDPNLDGSFDITTGLRLARRLLVDLAEMRVPAGTEFLDTITPQYYADLISWGAIGARTTESQVHRELASGLSMPVGFKNGTDGNVRIAIDAIRAAAQPHSFLSVTKTGAAAIVRTKGNQACHVILRGANSGPNYDEESVRKVVEQLEAAHLPPHVMIDCSHGNSSKNHENQPRVARALGEQFRRGNRSIGSIMIESHLVAGRQDVLPNQPLTSGQSITDACIDWPTTEQVLADLAEAVGQRMK